MSYDLAVFEPSMAPMERQAFLSWYDGQTQWNEPHGYDDPKVTSPRLAAWFMDMIKAIPPFNGPFGVEVGPDTDPASVAEYNIGAALIFAAFRWSRCDQAYAEVRRLAAVHHVGFFDASGEGTEIVYPPE